MVEILSVEMISLNESVELSAIFVLLPGFGGDGDIISGVEAPPPYGGP